ncbi:MAG: membrane dipeptidase, partial [Gemmatimonadales bacterium]
FSHSNSRALVDVPRNIPDSILKRLPANGGVAMITFVTSFSSPESYENSKVLAAAEREIRKRLGADTVASHKEIDAYKAAHPLPKVAMSEVIAHIEHAKQVAGIDHIGLGGDFDGITDVVQGLEDVSKYPALFAELAHRGWSDEDMKKLAGENVLGVLERAEQVAARLQKTRQPSTKTIFEMDGKK